MEDMLRISRTKAGSKWAQTLTTSCTASGSGYAVGFNLCPETLSPSLPLHRTCSNQVLHDQPRGLNTDPQAK